VEANSKAAAQRYPGSTPVEMVRLTEESVLFARAMRGPLAGVSPEQMTTFEHILDIASGPGDWVLDVAFKKSHIEVVGVELSENMVKYAMARARAQRLKNVLFQYMNWVEGLDFPDNTFDLVNARLLVLWLLRKDWPLMIREALRILRPGGLFRLIDCDTILTSSWAVDTIHHWTLQMYQRNGFGFSPTGRTLGMSPVLPHLVREAGFAEVQFQPYVIDFSARSENWSIMYRNIEMACTTLMPQVLALKIATQEQFDDVFRQVHIDMMSDNFYGLWPFFSLTGVKPA
jgi:ubiquinone/menaquinone biosynthesis C-methylase UbiE